MVGRRTLIKRGATAVAAAVAASALEATGTDATEPAKQKLPTRRALVLVDRSGSMGIVREATIEGLNKWIDDQRQFADLHVTILQFDEYSGTSGLEITETCKDVLAPNAPHITEADYNPRGGTPLYQAIGYGISELERQAGPDDKLLMVIQTDGGDTNYGKEINLESTKTLIKSKEDEGNWTFVFLGADMTAWESGDGLGFATGNVTNYVNTAGSTQATYTAASSGTGNWYRTRNLSTTDFFKPEEAEEEDKT